MNKEMLGSFDVEQIALETLLFQTGYLTIIDTDNSVGEIILTLGYPNLEVKKSLNNHLLSYLIHDSTPKIKNQKAVYQAILSGKSCPFKPYLFKSLTLKT